VSLVAIEKIVAGMLQGLVSAVLVFPIAAFVPATSPKLHVNWLILLTLAPLAGWTSAALVSPSGPRCNPCRFPAVRVHRPADDDARLHLLPVDKAGKHPLASSRRAHQPAGVHERRVSRRTHASPHMSLFAVYGALLGFAALFTRQGVKGFEGRVVS
jgi:ABC-2 type transport system permease protein